MHRLIVPLFILGLFSTELQAQTTGTPEDHEALRKLKDQAVAVVNNRDYDAARRMLHVPFMATVITQDSFTEFDQVQAYFDGLYTRDFLRMEKIEFEAEADDFSWIHEGTFALTKGTTKEHYELADGRAFDMDGRWTAISIKDDDEWKLLAIHMGTNFLDNPVLAAIEKSVVWIGATGAGIGLILGFAGGWFFTRRRQAA